MKKLLLILLSIVVVPGFLVGGEPDPLADHAQAIVARTGITNIEGIAYKNELGEYVTFFEYMRVFRPIGKRGRFDRPDAPTASPVLPTGTCDSIEECEKKLQQLCEDFKDDDLKEGSAKLTVAPNGTVTCGGTCKRTKAEPFATCGKPNKS